MSKLVIELEVDNAAFEEVPEYEVARILQELANQIKYIGIGPAMPLHDINGNLVGFCREEVE